MENTAGSEKMIFCLGYFCTALRSSSTGGKGRQGLANTHTDTHRRTGACSFSIFTPQDGKSNNGRAYTHTGTRSLSPLSKKKEDKRNHGWRAENKVTMRSRLFLYCPHRRCCSIGLLVLDRCTFYPQLLPSTLVFPFLSLVCSSPPPPSLSSPDLISTPRFVPSAFFYL